MPINLVNNTKTLYKLSHTKLEPLVIIEHPEPKKKLNNLSSSLFSFLKEGN